MTEQVNLEEVNVIRDRSPSVQAIKVEKAKIKNLIKRLDIDTHCSCVR